MKQESIHHPQHRPYPRDPQIRAYHHGEDEGDTQGTDPVEGPGHRGSIHDWQNPSRFRRDRTR